MIDIAIFNSLVVFFAYLTRYKHTKSMLKISFILIFLFLALRYNYGNDYAGYLEGFLEINRYVSIDYNDKFQNYEIGWILLCRLFGPLGFFAMTAVLALFNCLVYYHFIRKYVPPAYYWIAVFLYVFTPGFMLIHSSAMRQSIAISLFLLAFDHLNKKDPIRYFLYIGIASLFHTSALLLLPVYLIGRFNWKINKLMAVSFFSLYIGLFMFGESFKSELNLLISNYFERYTVYQEGSEIGTGLGLIVYSALFLLILYYAKMQNRERALLFKITILSFLLIPVGLLLIMFGRVEMYFKPATLVVFPIILLNINNPVSKNIITAVIIAITIYSFYGFFQSDVYKEAFATYQTIFSSPQIY